MPAASAGSLERVANHEGRGLNAAGYAWIHAMGEEEPLLLPSRNLEEHAAVFGTTGAGKSRFLELMIHQAVLMGVYGDCD